MSSSFSRKQVLHLMHLYLVLEVRLLSWDSWSRRPWNFHRKSVQHMFRRRRNSKHPIVNSAHPFTTFYMPHFWPMTAVGRHCQ